MARHFRSVAQSPALARKDLAHPLRREAERDESRPDIGDLSIFDDLTVPQFHDRNAFKADATAQIAGLGYQAYLLPSPIVIVADGQLVVRSNAAGAARGSLGLAAFADVIWLLIGRFPALGGMAHGYGACLDSAAWL